jgi:hypothetical protein
MQKLSKDEMKKVIGGIYAPPEPPPSSGGSWCSTTFNCSDGSKKTLTCEHAEAGCVGIDASSSDSGNGYGYCEENGTIYYGLCDIN